MTPNRLRQCLRVMNWTNATLAEALGCTETLVIAWALGYAELPDEVCHWIEILAQFHEYSDHYKPKFLRGADLEGWDLL